MALYPTWEHLPEEYNAAIGRIVSRQAILEDNLHKLIWALLEVEPSYGRLAVPCPRAADAVTRIADLMQLRGLHTKINMKSLQSSCRQLEEFRDKLAHGVWAKHPESDNPILQITAGKNRDGTKARISPYGGNAKLETLKSYEDGINQTIDTIRELSDELGAQHAALLHKRSEQSRSS
jgi:hypothetical protein